LSMEQLEYGTVCPWPHYTRDQEGNQTIVTIVPGEYCQCVDCKAFQHQCCHELACDQEFLPDKYDQRRWIMSKVFHQKPPWYANCPIVRP
jgi:hypothetical protein